MGGDNVRSSGTRDERPTTGDEGQAMGNEGQAGGSKRVAFRAQGTFFFCFFVLNILLTTSAKYIG